MAKRAFAWAKAGDACVRIDLTDLRLFVNIARTQSITRGAELSHLSLPPRARAFPPWRKSLA